MRVLYKKDKLLKIYPKMVKLKTGEEVMLRPLVRTDKEPLLEFFRRLPERDRMFLRDDVAKEETVSKWTREMNYNRVLPIIAEHHGRIIADATLHRREHSWTRHVGEIRIVIDEKWRGRGLGSILVKEIYGQARKRGIEKLIAEMADDQKDAMRVFEKFGFSNEAILKGHVIDADGNHHDLIIMSMWCGKGRS